MQEKKQKGLQHKDLLSIHDLTSEEVERILTMAQKLKRMQKIGVPHEYCKGKTLAMLFSVPVFLLKRDFISWAAMRST